VGFVRFGPVRTDGWYGDRPLELVFPAEWDVEVFSPRTPPALSDGQLAAALERPTGQPPLRELARGARRPLVLVDDLTRPTPAASILPHVLRHLADAGVAETDVTVLIATGTHGPPPPGGPEVKAGPGRFRLLAHDAFGRTASLGRSSAGTPILVDPAVAAADFVVGIGGLYPNHTAGFGGGSKLALGALGARSILALHTRHGSLGWGSYAPDSPLRRDLDEIAARIRLRTTISVHVDAAREIVRIACGDQREYLRDEAAFSRSAFTAPAPGDADVVICNAYPGDMWLTFVRMKGMTPLVYAKPEASRVVVASVSQGLGYHGLFPYLNAPPRHRERRALMRLRSLRARELPGFVAARLRRPASAPAAPRPAQRPAWLFRTGPPGTVPAEIPGMHHVDSWDAVVEGVRREQAGGGRLRAVVYECTPIQWIAEPFDGPSWMVG